MKKIIKDLLNSSQKNPAAFINFAKEHSLVFTPELDEEYDGIRGIAFSKRSSDGFLVQGVSQGHDISIIQRTVPSVNNPEPLTWTILQVSTDAKLPHVYIDGHRHLKEVYDSAFSAFGHYKNVSSHLNESLDYFGSHFQTYASAEDASMIEEVFSKDALRLIYDHGANLDYETDDHFVRVYNLTNQITTSQIEDMFILAQNLVHLFEINLKK